jgi:K+-sensing histidine kinase KdpD
VVLIAGRRSFAEAPEVEVEVEYAPVLSAPVLVAVDATARGATVTAAAAKLATERGAAVEVLHVHQTEVLEEDAVDRESRQMAGAVLALRLEQLRAAGVPAGGEVVHTYGNRDDAAQAVLDRVDEVGAQLVVVGREGRVSSRATVPVVVVPA